MKLDICSFLVFVLFSNNICGQNLASMNGGRAMALAGASIALQDQWAAFNNVAGTAKQEFPSGMAGCTRLHGMNNLYQYSAAAILPTGHGVLSGTAQRIGDKLFNQQHYTLGVSRKVGFISLGTACAYNQYFAEGFGSTSIFSINFGGMVSISEKLLLGAHVYNLTQSSIETNRSMDAPESSMRLGLSYKPLTQLMLNSEIQKSINRKLRYKAGIEYTFIEKISLRTGIQTNPTFNFFGLGFRTSRFQFDYAVALHAQLGLSHQLSVNYKFI